MSSEEEWRAALLYGLTNSLRYVMVELGSAIVSHVQPEDFLETARYVQADWNMNLSIESMPVKRGLIECFYKLTADSEKMVEELKPYARELVEDFMSVSRIRDVGNPRLKDKHLRRLVRKHPSLLELPELQKHSYVPEKVAESSRRQKVVRR
ncbi:MAG: hypothetical protein QXS85_06155 [Acidilobaceae archaeon]